MIKGRFYKNENIPLVQVTIGCGDRITSPYLVLDTGFTGDIKISKQVANELGMQVIGSEPVMNMNGEIIQAPLALAYAELEGEKKAVNILIVDGMDLAGIGLYTKFGQKITIDCKNRTVELERASDSEEFDE